MKSFTRRAIVLAVLMLSASMLTVALTPTQRVAPEAALFDLESLIPHHFGDWQTDERMAQAVINPQLQAAVSNLYSQTLSRTYVNSDGRRIMLSLAYGEDQASQSRRIHRPEICYPSQGFQMHKKWKDTISTSSMTIPVMRITTQLGNRHEPVTYWIRIGDTLARGIVEQTFVRINYGLTGSIPDGILFRVSEISTDFQDSFAIQDQFINALLPSLTPNGHKILLGSARSKNDVNMK